MEGSTRVITSVRHFRPIPSKAIVIKHKTHITAEPTIVSRSAKLLATQKAYTYKIKQI